MAKDLNRKHAKNKNGRAIGSAARPGFHAVFEELEPRLLFSADAAMLVHPGFAASDSGQNAPLIQVLPPLRETSYARTTNLPPHDSTVLAAASASVATRPTEIVFVDAHVDKAQDLVAAIIGQQGGQRSLEIHWLDAQHDGVAQITAALNGRHDIAAVHIISHGEDGSLQLGSTVLNAKTLSSHVGQLAQWRQALTSNADLMIYGCDVAATASGQHFVDDLSLITGMGVAASTDETGASALGGNWRLEFDAGKVETASLLKEGSTNGWQGLLSLTASGG